MKNVLVFFLFLPVFSFSSDNSLYMPLNIKKAYQKGTRTYDGVPGEAYWQNRSEYQIKVKVFPERALIKGEEGIVYFNNSPDTLYRIIIRLYQDIYREGNARDWQIDPISLHKGIDLYNFRVNGTEIDLDNPDGPARRTGTNLRVELENPLYPESSIELFCQWKFTLPQKSWLRMGAYSDSSLFVAYWYPQIAVYDDIDGWDYSGYGGTQEFYNDMSDFNVEITAPGDFLVWGTGLLKNARAVLREPYLNRFLNAFQSDTVIRVIGRSDIGSDSIVVSQEKNTWRFQAESVPDFAFAVCRNHFWDALSVDVNNPAGDRALVQAVYPHNSPDFHQVTEFSKSILEYLSKEMPGIPYPFPSMTAYNRPGGGGMEFPMMINDGSSTEKARTVSLTGHEIIHSYFPFYMGINERKYAWMDEGWAVALNYDPLHSIIPEADGFISTIRNYLALAGNEYDLPMMIPSTMMRGPAYRNASYNRSAVAYHMLREYLGDARFREALRTFVSRWKYKHPIPYDFFFTFDRLAGEDLSWFWNPWFFDRGYPDLTIYAVENDTITVEKSGLLPVPVHLILVYDDGSEELFSEPMSVWKDGKKYVQIPLKSQKKLLRASLDTERIPDVNKSNNEYLAPSN